MAFFALELEPRLGDSIWEFFAPWRYMWATAAWVHPRDYHLTLRFLGGLARTELESILRGFEALPPPRPVDFSLSWKGTGAFIEGGHSAVLWLALREEPIWLRTLQQELEESARRLGLAGETRPFAPHVTMARMRGEEVQQIASEWKEIGTPTWGPQLCKSYQLMKRSLGASEKDPQPLFEVLRNFGSI